MEISMFQQTSAFLWAFVLGTVIALSYTVFVSVRDVFSCSNVGVFISDAVFSFFVSVIHFLYAVAMTEGRIRLYVIAAQIISFFVIWCFAGRYIKKYIVYYTGKIKAFVCLKPIIRRINIFCLTKRKNK